MILDVFFLVSEDIFYNNFKWWQWGFYV